MYKDWKFTEIFNPDMSHIIEEMGYSEQIPTALLNSLYPSSGQYGTKEFDEQFDIYCRASNFYTEFRVEIYSYLLQECIKTKKVPELEHLKRGDVFFEYEKLRNDGLSSPLFWDGEKLICEGRSLDTGYGNVPECFKTIFEFPVGFWKHIHWHNTSYVHLDRKNTPVVENIIKTCPIEKTFYPNANNSDLGYYLYHFVAPDMELEIPDAENGKQNVKFMLVFMTWKDWKDADFRKRIMYEFINSGLHISDFDDYLEYLYPITGDIRCDDNVLKPKNIETLFMTGELMEE